MCWTSVTQKKKSKRQVQGNQVQQSLPSLCFRDSATLSLVGCLSVYHSSVWQCFWNNEFGSKIDLGLHQVGLQYSKSCSVSWCTYKLQGKTAFLILVSGWKICLRALLISSAWLEHWSPELLLASLWFYLYIRLGPRLYGNISKVTLPSITWRGCQTDLMLICESDWLRYFPLFPIKSDFQNKPGHLEGWFLAAVSGLKVCSQNLNSLAFGWWLVR